MNIFTMNEYSRGTPFRTLFAVFLALVAAPAWTYTYTWTGASSNLWSTAANWNRTGSESGGGGATAPTQHDDVIIQYVAGRTTVTDTGQMKAKTLSIASGMKLSTDNSGDNAIFVYGNISGYGGGAGTIELKSDYGMYICGGGTWAPDGPDVNVTNTGSNYYPALCVSVSGGIYDFYKDLNLRSFIVEQGRKAIIYSMFNVANTIKIETANSGIDINNGTLNNNGTMTIENGGTLNYNTTTSAPFTTGNLINNGTMNIDSSLIINAGKTLTLGSNSTSTVKGAWTRDGTLSAANNSQVTFNAGSGTHTIDNKNLTYNQHTPVVDDPNKFGIVTFVFGAVYNLGTSTDKGFWADGNITINSTVNAAEVCSLNGEISSLGSINKLSGVSDLRFVAKNGINCGTATNNAEKFNAELRDNSANVSWKNAGDLTIGYIDASNAGSTGNINIQNAGKITFLGLAGNNNYGVENKINAKSNITVTATGTSSEIFFDHSAAPLLIYTGTNSAGTTLSFIADKISMAASNSVSIGFNGASLVKVALKPYTASTPIGINYSTFNFNVPQILLENIFAGELVIGHETGTGIMVIGDEGSGNLSSESYNLTIQSPNQTADTGSDLMGDLTLGASKTLTINIGGYLVDGGYGKTLAADTLFVTANRIGGSGGAYIKTSINNLGASTLNGAGVNNGIFIQNDKALNVSGAVTAASGTISIDATGAITQSAAGILTAVNGYFNKTGAAGGAITLDQNNMLTNVFLRNYGNGSSVDFKNNTSFTLAAITNGGALSAITQSGNLTVGTVNSVDGIKTTQSSSTGGAVILDASSGTITLAKNIDSTGGSNSGGPIDFQKAVTLSANIIVNSSGAGAGTGGSITFLDAISGNYELEVNAGTGGINVANSVTTGNQTYKSNVFSGGNVEFDAGASGSITFSGNINTGAGNQTYKSAVSLNGTAAQTFTGGTLTYEKDVTGIRNTTFAGAVALAGTGAKTISTTANNANIIFNSTITGNYNLTLTANGSGTISLGGDVNTGAGNTQTYNNAVVITGTGTKTLTGQTLKFYADVTSTSANFTAAGAVEFYGARSINVSSTITLNGNVTGDNSITFEDAVVLGGTGAKTFTTTANNGNINFNSTLNGAFTLTLGATGTGKIKFGGAVGGGTALAGLIISGGTLDTTTSAISISGNLNSPGTAGAPFNWQSTTITFSGAGTSTISGANSFYNLSCAAAGKTITMPQRVNAANPLKQIVRGSLTLTGTSGNEIILTSSGGAAANTTWFELDAGAASRNITYTKISYGYSTSYIMADVAPAAKYNIELVADSTYNFWYTANYEWTGATNTNWDTPGNWNTGYHPPPNKTGFDILIPDNVTSNRYPLLTVDITNNTKITIGTSTPTTHNASLDLNGKSFTVATVDNYGTLKLLGTEPTVSVTTKTNRTGSVVEYHGTAAAAQEKYGASYQTLRINMTGAGIWKNTLATSAVKFENPSGASGKIQFDSNLTVSGTDATAFYSAVLIGSNIIIEQAGANITFNNTIDGAAANALTVKSNNVITYGGAIGNTTALAALLSQGVTSDAVGSTTINTTVIKASNDIGFMNAVTISAAPTITSSAGRILFSTTVNGAYSLTLSAAAASEAVTFNGIVGGTTPLTSITVTGLTKINTTAITTSGTQTYNSAVTLAAAPTFTTTNNGSINFNSTLNGAFNLTLNANGTGKIKFGGNAGGTAALANLTISNGELDTSSASITLTGNLSAPGAASSPFIWSNTEIIFSGTGSSSVSGANTFYKLSCAAAGKTIMFPARGTAPYVRQTIQNKITLTGAAGNLIILKSSDGTATAAAQEKWFHLIVTAAAANVDVTYTHVQFGYSVNDLRGTDLVGDTSKNNLGDTPFNTYNFFTRSLYVWDGGANTTLWTTAANWEDDDPPPLSNAAVDIEIKSTGVTYFPVLTVTISNRKITVYSGASLDLNGQSVTLATGIINNGTLKLKGGETLGGTFGTKTNNTGSTVEYYGTANITENYSSTYDTLKISTTGTWTSAAAISAAQIDTASTTANLNLAHDISITGAAAQTTTITRPIVLQTAARQIISTNAVNLSLVGVSGNFNFTVDVKTGTITLNNDVNTGTGNTQTYKSAVSTVGARNLTASTITLHNNVTGNNTITFTGAVTLAGNVVFSTAAGSTIVFTQDVSGGAYTFTAQNAVNLTKTSAQTITASAITFYNNVTGSNQNTFSGPVTLAGNVVFSTAAGSNLVFTQDVSGGTYTFTAQNAVNLTKASAQTITASAITFYNNVTGSNQITFAGPVTLAGTGAKTISTTNNNIIFNSTINGNYALTLDAGTGTVTFGGIVGGTTALASLAVTGAATANTSAITTAGTQTYNNNFTLGTGAAPLTFTTTNSAVTFSSTINAAGYGAQYPAFNVGSGNISFGGNVGTTTNRLTSLTIPTHATATVTFAGGAANIVTTGAQIYGRPLLLGGTSGSAKTFTTNNGAVTFSSTINAAGSGTQSIAIANGTGTVTFGGIVGGANAPSSLAVNGTGNITINTSAITTTAAINFYAAATGSVSLTLDAGTSGTITLNGNVTTTGNTQTYKSAVTVTGARTITATTINLHNNVTGNNSLTFDGAVALAGTGAKTISATASNGSINFNSTVTGNFDLTVQANNTGVINLAGNINTGTANSQTYKSNVTTSAAVTLTASTMYLGANVTFTTNNNGITFAAKIDSDSATYRNLTFVTGTGTITFNDNIGSVYPIQNLTITSGALASGTNKTITLAGDISSPGTAAALYDWQSTSIVFTGAAAATVSGANKFNNLSCATAKTIKFPQRGSGPYPTDPTDLTDENAFMRQQITGVLTLNGVTLTASGTPLASSPATAAERQTWFHLVIPASASNVIVSNTTVTYGVSEYDLRGASLVGGVSSNSGTTNNTRWFFNRTGDYIWTGASNNSWLLDANWDDYDRPLPGAAVSVSIPNVSSASNTYPLLNVAITANTTITIASGATLDLNGYSVTLTSIVNNGTLKLNGAETASVTTKTNNPGSTVEYYGTTTNVTENYSSAYKALKISKTIGTWTSSANISAASIETASTAALDLRHNLTTSAASTINGPVTIANATNPTINTTNTNITFGSTINGAQALTISGGAGAVTFGGIVGGTAALASLTRTGTGTTNINTTSIKTSGAQSYAGAVTGGASFTLDAGTAGTITFAGNVTSTGYNQTYKSAVSLTGTGTRTLTGSTLTFEKDVTGAAGLAQVYAGAVVLAGTGAKTFTTNNSNITFSSTVNGGYALTVAAGTGAVTFGGIVGGATALTSLTRSGTGATNINTTAVTTSGAQSYGGNIALGSTAALSTTNNNIQITGSITTTTNTRYISFGANTGNITVGGSVGATATANRLNQFIVPANGAYTISLASGVYTTGAQTYNRPITGTGNLTFDAGTSTITSGANITSTGFNQTYKSAVTTTGTGTPRNITITASAVTFEQQVTSESLTINSDITNGVFDIFISADILNVSKTNAALSTTNKNIKFNVDGLTLASGASINAGSGDFQIYPKTNTYTIEYGDANTPIVTDVYYSSAWGTVTANQFIVGDNSHNGEIYLSGVGAPGSRNQCAVEFRNTSSIYIRGNYYTNNKNLTLKTNAIEIDGSRAADLGTGNFSVSQNANIILTNLAAPTTATTVQITAANINLRGNISADSDTARSIELGGSTTFNQAADAAITTSGGTITLGGNVTNTAKNLYFDTRNQSGGAGNISVTQNSVITASLAEIYGSVSTNTTQSLKFDCNLTNQNLNSIINADTFEVTGELRSYGDITLAKKSAVTSLTINNALNINALDSQNIHKTITINSDAVHSGTGSLNVQNGIFDIQNYNYQLGTGSGTGLYGNGSLTMAAGTMFVVGLLAGGTGRSINLSGTLNLDATSTLVMNGTGSINIGAGQLGSFEIGANGVVTAISDLVIKGDWTQPQNSATRFDGNHTVTFVGTSSYKTITISGNTSFYDFVIDNNATNSYIEKVLFSNWGAANDAHKFLHSVKINGTASKRITLDRKDNSGGSGIVDPPYTPTLVTLPLSPDQNFWVINIPTGATHDFNFMTVYHSYAAPEMIHISPTKVTTGVKSPWWTINWNNEFFYVFAFTEDTDGDGRIDRLRIQSTAPVNGTTPPAMTTSSGSPIPSGLRIEVEGYELAGVPDTPGTPTPRYWLGVPAQAPAPAGSYSFLYVKLKPNNKPDTNATPKWRLISAGNVLDAYSGTTLGVPVDFEKGFPTTDTSPPRVIYSLLHPERGELYVRFSEPVQGPFPAPINTTGSVSFNNGSTAGEDGARFSPVTSLTNTDVINTIFADTRYDDSQFTAAGTSGREYGWPQYPQSLMQWIMPQYPTNVNYSNYEAVNMRVAYPGNLNTATFSSVYNSNGKMLAQAQSTPPASADWSWTASPWKNSRRLSDVILLAQPSSSSPTVTLWPNYATSTDAPASSPNTTINQWDGLKALIVQRDWDTNNIFAALEIFVRNSIFSTAPSLLFSIDTPSRYREAGGAGRLWLPPTAGSLNTASNIFDPVSNIVPETFSSTRPPDSYTGSPDFTYTFDLANLSTKGVFDFIFKINTGAPLLVTYPLYAVRLDPRTSAWWEGLRPFSFVLRDIARQRGGVTVVKNVLNPLKGDETTLNYVLRKPGQVTINVFTMEGSVVRTLERGHLAAGEHFVRWNGRNNSGNAVARGIYFIRIVGPGIDEIRKVMLVK